MNGLKVYLKSGITKVYVYAQAVVGILLIGNALREYEHAQNHFEQLLSTVAVGLMLMLSVATPKRWRRQLRLVPGILIALGGMSLLWLTKTSSVHVYYAFNPLLMYISYGLVGVGLLQPLVDHRHFAYFHSQGVRYRVHAFRTDSVAWNEVKGIVYFDQGFDLALKNRKTYRMRPYNGESQNLRLYIDQMLQNGRQNAGKVSTPAVQEEEERASVRHTPVADA